MAKRCRGVRMTLFDKILAWALLLGGINWGLVVFNWNLVDWIANGINFPTLAKIIYGIVGFSAVWTMIRSFMGFK